MGDADLAERLLALERRVAALEVRLDVEPVGLELSDDEIVAMLQRGKKIEAVDLYRRRTGAGLREAKTAVERVEAQYLAGG